jgi:hypothetical protein
MAQELAKGKGSHFLHYVIEKSLDAPQSNLKTNADSVGTSAPMTKEQAKGQSPIQLFRQLDYASASGLSCVKKTVKYSQTTVTSVCSKTDKANMQRISVLSG